VYSRDSDIAVAAVDLIRDAASIAYYAAVAFSLADQSAHKLADLVF